MRIQRAMDGPTTPLQVPLSAALPEPQGAPERLPIQLPLPWAMSATLQTIRTERSSTFPTFVSTLLFRIRALSVTKPRQEHQFGLTCGLAGTGRMTLLF